MRETILQKLKSFFPAMGISQKADSNEVGIEGGYRFELISDPDNILSYLQTIFFEERLIEVQIDNTTQMFFATLWDSPTYLDVAETEDGDPIIDPDYEEGDYLKDLEHIILSPLEPATGNIKIRSSEQVVLRFYTGTTAVELGTHFLRAGSLGNTPIIVLEFPSIGRIIPNNRPFRARITQEIQLEAVLNSSAKNIHDVRCRILDISAMGMLVEHENLHETLDTGDSVWGSIFVDKKEQINVNMAIRNFARLRTKEGNANICGMQFDLENRALAEQIEQLFAKIQRVFLRSIANKTEGKDITLKS